MCRAIAISNRKGGSGKTTTAVNVAAGLAHLGRRVLIVDADSQAHTTLSFGLRLGETDPDLTSLLLGESTLESTIAGTYLERLKVVPASRRLLVYEREFAKEKSHLTRMRTALSRAFELFDYVVVDTAPYLGLLTYQALLLASEVIVPTQAHYLSMEGLAEILSATSRIARSSGRPIRVTGVIPTFFNERARMSKTVMSEIHRELGTGSILGPVRSSVALAEAPAYGKTIFQYDSASNGARDYLRIATQIEGNHGC